MLIFKNVNWFYNSPGMAHMLDKMKAKTEAAAVTVKRFTSLAESVTLWEVDRVWRNSRHLAFQKTSGKYFPAAPLKKTAQTGLCISFAKSGAIFRFGNEYS
jgi:hypothetical protein